MGSIIRGVKLENQEKGDKLFYQARTLKLKIGSTSYTTPMRFINHQEMNSKINLPADVPIINACGTFKKVIDPNSFLKIKKSNGYNQHIIKTLEFWNEPFSYFPLKAVCFRPSDKLQQEINNLSKALNFLREIFEFLRWSNHNFNLLIIPFFLNLPSREAEEYIKWLSKNEEKIIEKTKVESIVFTLDPAYKNVTALEKMLINILETLQTKNDRIIGIIHRKVPTYLASFKMFWNNLYEKDICVWNISVDRSLRYLYNLSGPHYNSFVTGDVFSLRPIRVFGPITKPVSVTTRFFLKDKLTIEKFANIIQEKGEEKALELIYNEFTEMVKNRRHIRYIKNTIENWRMIETEPNLVEEKKRIFSSLSRMHEILSSTKEFQKLSRYIKNSEVNEYIKAKSFLKKALEKVSFKEL